MEPGTTVYIIATEDSPMMRVLSHDQAYITNTIDRTTTATTVLEAVMNWLKYRLPSTKWRYILRGTTTASGKVVFDEVIGEGFTSGIKTLTELYETLTFF